MMAQDESLIMSSFAVTELLSRKGVFFLFRQHDSQAWRLANLLCKITGSIALLSASIVITPMLSVQ